jgi:hypothetical protein
MIEELEKNIDTEIAILREIASYSSRQEIAQKNERRILESAIESLQNALKIINNSLPKIIREVGGAEKKIGESSGKKTIFEKVNFRRKNSEVVVTLDEKDKARFIEELSISESFINRIKKEDKIGIDKYQEFKATRGYLKLSNRLFLNQADKIIKSGKFKRLYSEIKRADIEILFQTYVAMILLTTLISFFAGIFIFIFLMIFNVSFELPFISVYSGDILLRAVKLIWLIAAVPVGTFAVLYFYPS